MQPLPPPAPRNLIVAPTELPAVSFVEAQHYRRRQRRHRSLWLVLHATDGWEGVRKAEDCAAGLANVGPGKQRSPHLVIDTNSIVQCVPFQCEAWHAGDHANRYGEGIELCGRAGQTREQWLDALSLPMLALAARVVRWRCEALRLPIVALDAKQLRGLQPGVTTHAEITKAFPQDTNHWDPGPGFPLRELLWAARGPLRTA